MDLLSVTRTLGGLGTVLGILWGALWLVRRYDIQLPGRTGMARRSRLELVERLAIDARRSVAVLRRDGKEHLILIAPEGHLVIESGFGPTGDGLAPPADGAAEDIVFQPVGDRPTRWEERPGESFGALVEKVRLYGVPVTPVTHVSKPEPVYQPARKTPARRRKAAGTAAHA
jgi:hypothetical protein